jgi:hypothetical protein
MHFGFHIIVRILAITQTEYYTHPFNSEHRRNIKINIKACMHTRVQLQNNVCLPQQ